MAKTSITKQLEEVIKKSVAETVAKIERPFGLLLSGGVDSALLAALTKPDVVLTCKFPYGEKYDEFPYAEKIVKHLGLKQEVVEITKEDFEQHLPSALKAFRPTTHFSLVPLFIAFKRAYELGLKTVLSGEGPDEYLGGYASYSFITHEQKLYEQEELQHYRPALDKYLGSPMERFAKILGKPLEELAPYWDRYENLLSKIGYTDLKLRGIEEMELALAQSWKVNLLYPYMSSEVEEFCFTQVPDNWKIRGFTTKYIEKKIAEKYLPKEVVWRKNKMGGPVAPVGIWLGEEDEFSKVKYLQLQNELWKDFQLSSLPIVDTP